MKQKPRIYKKSTLRCAAKRQFIIAKYSRELPEDTDTTPIRDDVEGSGVIEPVAISWRGI